LEPGKLFGALAVLQAISQTILGVSSILLGRDVFSYRLCSP
jgi:hypothetical protein